MGLPPCGGFLLGFSCVDAVWPSLSVCPSLRVELTIRRFLKIFYNHFIKATAYILWLALMSGRPCIPRFLRRFSMIPDFTPLQYKTNSNLFQCFSRYVRGVRGRCFRPLPPASGAPRPLRAPFSPHKCRNCGRIPRRASAGGAGGRPRSGHAWPSFRLAGGRYFRPLPHASGDPACGGAP